MAGLRIWRRKKDEKTESLLKGYDERYQRFLNSLSDFTGIVDRKGRLQFEEWGPRRQQLPQLRPQT